MIDIHGTSHIAGAELDCIRAAVAESGADVVALEIDPRRLQALIQGQSRGTPNSPFFLLMKAVQDMLGRSTGVAPGSDMLAAFRAAQAQGVDVALIDQDIAVTLQELRAVPLREKVKFAGFLLLSPLLIRGMDVDLDTVPEEELVEEMLLRFRVGFPAMHRVLVAERNRVMAERLTALEDEYGDVLAFVGAGHVDGIREQLDR